MAKTFDVQAALKAGYSRDEINSFLGQNQNVRTPGYSAPAKPMSGLLGSILNPVARYGQNALGAGYELFRGAKSALGDKNAYYNQETGQVVQNPFLSEQQLSAFDSQKGNGVANVLAQLATKNSGVRQGLKDTANVASYAVPVGKGATLATKVLAPGAVSGGLTALSNEDVSAKSVLGGAVGGAATSGALAGLGKIFNKTGQLAQGAGGKLAQKAEKKATQDFLKTSPSVFQKAIDDHGFDVGQKAQKYGFTKMGLDDILGDVSSRGKGGVLQANLDEAEKVIQQTANIAGKNIKISGDDIVKELTKRATEEAKKLGGGSRAAAIKEIAEQAKKNYKNGVTVKQALKILRDANSSFGKSVVEDTSGAVATSAQKLEANTMRTALKKMFPEIKDALDQQSELLTLRPILNQARAKASTTGVAKSAVGLNELMGIIGGAGSGFAAGGPVGGLVGATTGLVGKKLVDSPLANRIAAKGLEKTGGVAANAGMNPMLQQILMTGASKVGGNATSSLLNEPGVVPVNESNNDPSYNNSEQFTPPNVPSNQGAGEADSIPQQGGFPTITPDLLAEGILALPPEAASKLKQIYDIQQKANPQAQQKPLSGEQIKQVNLAKRGTRSLDKVESLLGLDKGRFDSSKLNLAAFSPGKLGARDYDNATFDATDALLKAYSGASSSKEEVIAYRDSLFPRAGDSEETVKSKIAQLRANFGDLMNQSPAAPTQQFDPSALAQMGIGL